MNQTLQSQTGSLEQLAKFAASGYLYAIVDSVDAPGIVEKARELGADHAAALFCDSSEEEVWSVSPFLFHVEQRTLEWIAETLWNQAWGVFVMSKSGMEEVREHLRKFLVVLLPDGERWFFRYYDPRILKVYLPACNEAELQVFFGPVRAFAIKTPEEAQLWIVQRAAVPITSGEVQAAVGNGHGPWRVRPEQYSALAKAAHLEFLGRVTAHVRQFFPERCAELNEEGTAKVIEAGTERAAAYGITGEGEVCRFVDLMFGFGYDFDSSAAFAWAVPVLRDESKTATEKLDLIFAEVIKMSQQQEGAVAAG